MSDAKPRPTRKYGQNFLAEPRLAAKLVELFAPGPDDVVVEIGPGRGALTRGLAEKAGRFVALEIDPRLIDGVKEILAPFPNAEVHLADALEIDWDALSAHLGGPLRVVGNLPYNVGTPIVRRLIASDAVLDTQVVLQLEVAERLLAEPGTKDYDPLSIVAALRCEREKLRVIKPGSFTPAPKVTSCALRLRRLAAPPLAAEEVGRFEYWAFSGFAQRRKTLANNIERHRTLIEQFLVSCGLPADARGERLTPTQWLTLADAMTMGEVALDV